MENLINTAPIWCFIAFLAFMLNMAVSAKARRDAARASKHGVGLQQREHPAHLQPHCTCHTGGHRRPPRLGAEAIVSERPREGCRRTHRASAHGKECTPC
jgi:hypothetical protein